MMKNALFINKIFDQNVNPITQMISTTPTITVAAIAASAVLNGLNTTPGMHVVETPIGQSVVETEIENYLFSNSDTKDFLKTLCSNGTIMLQW